MATYSQITTWVRQNRGFTIHHPCWIAHCKELAGLPVKRSHNRRGTGRIVPCPIEKRAGIFAAFRHFGMI